MDELIQRELKMKLIFEKRIVELEFPEPCIYDLLRFNLLVKQEKYISAIKLIIPKIDEKDFLSNPIGIITSLKNLIYWEQKEKSWSSIEEDEAGFFPSSLDVMWNRYWQLPTELIKKITFTQMLISLKWYEWNLNIQNNQESKNIRLLMEVEWNKDQLDEDRKKIEEDREFFKKHWNRIKI